MTNANLLLPGDPAPYFVCPGRANPRFHFNTVGGRYIVLGFLGEDGDPFTAQMRAAIDARRAFFDDHRACFFGIIPSGPDDSPDYQDSLPGIRYLFDEAGEVSALYGGGEGDQRAAQWVVIDPGFNVVAAIPVDGDGAHIRRLNAVLDSAPPVDSYLGLQVSAPIIVVPNVFEPDLCRGLVSLYKTNGGEDSGFMREVAGKTVGMVDYSHKRRRDYSITDENLVRQIQQRFLRRVVPAIQKAHQFGVTRMERHIVACYSAEERGHFRPHRDNTTKGTAHRRFAVTINLNTDFDGGELSFPEFGTRSYKPPAGSALVFSCSLLHTVAPVLRGDRYAYLPFLYDDAAAAIRQQNVGFLAEKSALDAGEQEDPS